MLYKSILEMLQNNFRNTPKMVSETILKWLRRQFEMLSQRFKKL
jgi:hypothetical protein